MIMSIKLTKSWHEIYALAVKQVGMFAVYVGNGVDFDNERDKAAFDYVLSEFKRTFDEKEYIEYSGVLVNSGMFFFETEGDADTFFDVFNRPETEKTGLYAALYSPDRGCLTENC